jgi:signal transduction histidine kinase
VFKRKEEYEILNQMLDAAIAGKFEETVFDESELSKLQTKMMRYLTTASMSEKKINAEKHQLKTLITNISHQTRTPLTNILIYAELLQEQETDAATKTYTDEIVMHAKKLDQLVQALVKMSRLETGIFQFDKKNAKLSDIVSSLIDMGKRSAEEKHICLVTETPKETYDDACANFDSKWVLEAIYNILDNAIKYADEGTSIYISTFQYELFAGIRIRDEGPGIEADDIPRIFRRFFRGQKVHDKEGIGVGLYLNREIVKGQGGYVKVASKSGEGSTFEVFLPKEG